MFAATQWQRMRLHVVVCLGFDVLPPKMRSSAFEPCSQTAIESPNCAGQKKRTLLV